jgi:hypothetical protein
MAAAAVPPLIPQLSGGASSQAILNAVLYRFPTSGDPLLDMIIMSVVVRAARMGGCTLLMSDKPQHKAPLLIESYRPRGAPKACFTLVPHTARQASRVGCHTGGKTSQGRRTDCEFRS